MTTIGYGDFYPRTLPGRFLAFVLCIWGVIITSLMVVALSTYTELERKEKSAHHRIMDLELKEELRNNASGLIGSLYRLYKIYNKDTSIFRSFRVTKALRAYRKWFLQFRYTGKKMHALKLEADAINNFIIENDFLKFNFEEIQQNQDDLYESAQTILFKMKKLTKIQKEHEEEIVKNKKNGNKKFVRRSNRVSFLNVIDRFGIDNIKNNRKRSAMDFVPGLHSFLSNKNINKHKKRISSFNK